MKKIIALFLASVLAALLLCGCSIGKCDICGNSGFLIERTILGTDIYLCTDCNG